ncbi:alpha-hydroxy acid oxidase [Mesobaculum littorinae]|nr:alpha-hydroxy acid oxidase [Mesobaculum littorinae]
MTVEDRLARWRRRYPRVADLAPRARRRLPGFLHDFVVGGLGDDLALGGARAALDAVEIVPRYGVGAEGLDTGATLFGERFAAPLAIAPIGGDGSIWPGATRAFARAARAARLPYMAGTLASHPVEQVAGWLEQGRWFQLYTMPGDDHRVSLDLLARAAAAGVTAVAVTVDVPLPARRYRDMRNGLRMPMRPGPRHIAQAASRPAWLAALARHGVGQFANLAPYADAPDRGSIGGFVAREGPGAGAGWPVLARLRDAFPGAMLVKGLQHPADAANAVALGYDGVIVSNHGGRQFDAAPAPIDVLPAIRDAVGPAPTLLLDGGILSGLDILRAQVCGADGVLAGRAFMLGLAALGQDGPAHVAETLIDEYRIALGQSGALTGAGARGMTHRHPGRWPALAFGEEAP